MLRRSLRHRSISLAALVLASAVLLSACSLQPRGTTVFEIEGKTDYDKATLAFPETDEKRDTIKLRWVDTNVYTTTATLAPGQYLFTARTSDGLHYGREITVDAKTRRYKLPQISAGATTVAAGPPVTGSVTVASGQRPTELVVLFIGKDFTVRRITSTDGKFTVDGPAPGDYRFEIHGLGQPARTFTRERLTVSGPVDLGSITLH